MTSLTYHDFLMNKNALVNKNEVDPSSTHYSIRIFKIAVGM